MVKSTAKISSLVAYVICLKMCKILFKEIENNLIFNHNRAPRFTITMRFQNGKKKKMINTPPNRVSKPPFSSQTPFGALSENLFFFKTHFNYMGDRRVRKSKGILVKEKLILQCGSKMSLAHVRQERFSGTNSIGPNLMVSTTLI